MAATYIIIEREANGYLSDWNVLIDEAKDESFDTSEK